MLKRVMSRFFVEFACLAVAKKFCRGTLLCFTKFPVSKNSMDKRGGGRRKGVSQFSVENFCLTLPKKIAGERFYAVFQKTSGSEKVYA